MPLDPRVAAVLADAFLRFDANPHSAHGPGGEARAAVERAREQVAELIGVQPAEVVFTSGATEANNLAILGIASYLASNQRAGTLVGAGEHPSVLAAAAAAPGPSMGIPLETSGRLDLGALSSLLSAEVGLVSVAAANHELGTLQPMADIADRARGAGALVHSDLAQAAGKIPIDPSQLDLASLSAHKLGGPVGVGALMVRRSLRRRLRPIVHGGGHENGLRAGSLPAPLCVAFGEACRLARLEMREEARRVAELRDQLRARLTAIGGVQVNGGDERLPGNLNLSFDGVDGEALALRVRPLLSISTGSACSSTSLEPSHVLKAIGLGDREAEGAIRIGLGRATTEADVLHAADILLEAVRALRAVTRRAA